ncbi:hypothetical protein CYMTET_52803 [Cymbomonas tetramitiformis]|uniref:Uncharacterized protein n=1 Tax=Cymbomonas tetramitiformis TaxID=36881 RepID=A0AAE0BJZ5_9CHLO|nr:hypothetical protein CYMTET_52803 [Cymbomonas tetramitiformis]
MGGADAGGHAMERAFQYKLRPFNVEKQVVQRWRLSLRCLRHNQSLEYLPGLLPGTRLKDKPDVYFFLKPLEIHRGTLRLFSCLLLQGASVDDKTVI